jgi:hypothetical protein
MFFFRYIVAKIIERTQKGLAKASLKKGHQVRLQRNFTTAFRFDLLQDAIVSCPPRPHLTGSCKAGGPIELLQAYYVLWGHNAIDFICLKRNKVSFCRMALIEKNTADFLIRHFPAIFAGICVV